jgi:hypothetical protein
MPSALTRIKAIRAVALVVTMLGAVAAQPPHKPVPAKLKLTLQTLHAASLTAPRTPADSVDEPYLLVSVLGPKSSTRNVHLPATGHLRIHRDEALGARPLVDLSLAPGDSATLVVSVFDGARSKHADEVAAGTAAGGAVVGPSSTRATRLAAALQPLIDDRARWLGSATLLLANDGGTVYWRALDCLSSCRILSGTEAKPFSPGGAALTGVVELSGAGATYHMQLQGQQVKQL